MKTYELTYIISSQISSEEAEAARNELESFIQSKEGVILGSEKKGAQPLSYPIKKQGSGYFNITTFQIEEDKIKEMKTTIDKNNNILRSTIVVKKPVREVKEKRIRRPMFNKEFETQKKSSIMETTPYKEPKKEEKVSEEDLDKKIDELLQ